uniref:Uncharacterized protein n=1 Tax=Arundo donax TaxID=35708 RepID=A0A0A9A851_ARUDO
MKHTPTGRLKTWEYKLIKKGAGI